MTRPRLDVPYTAEFSADHAPAFLNAIGVMNGAVPVPLDGPFTWADFGCGHGITAVTLAAANRTGRFFGVDRDPRHIDTARRLCERGAVKNASFICSEFARLPADALPPLDFAVAHGVLSWLPGPERDALVARIAALLKPGGLLLASYDAMPGWAALLPLRDILLAVSEKVPGDAAARARAGLAWLEAYRAANVPFFQDHPAVGRFLDSCARHDPRYLAHEFLSDALEPLHFRQVQHLMERHGLHFTGSATAFLNMVDLAVPEPLLPEFRRMDSRAELEAKRDFLRNETFRRDVYVKAGWADTGGMAGWRARHLALPVGVFDGTTPPDREVSFGQTAVTFRGWPFDPLLAHLGVAARAVADLPSLAGLETLDDDTAIDAVRYLIAAGLATPMARPSPGPAPSAAEADAVQRFAFTLSVNRALIELLAVRQPTVPLASPVAGTAVNLPALDAMLVQGLVTAGRAGAVGHVRDMMAELDMAVHRGGEDLTGDAASAVLAERFAAVEAAVPQLLGLGVLAPAA